MLHRRKIGFGEHHCRLVRSPSRLVFALESKKNTFSDEKNIFLVGKKLTDETKILENESNNDPLGGLRAMAEKVARTGVTRDDKYYLYYIKQGAVWRVPRKQPGVPKGKPEMVVDGGIAMDSSYIYFLDKDGDIARSKRAIGGQKRKKVKKVKKVKKAKAKKPAKKKAAKKPAKKKPAKKAAKKPAKKAAKKPAKKKAAKKPAKKKAAKKPAKKKPAPKAKKAKKK